MDDSGETELKLGESSYMKNWQVTDNYKLRKRCGYIEQFASIANKPIQGMWYGSLNGQYHFLFACNGKIYENNGAANTEIGSLTDDRTVFFAFNNVIYILNGHEYKFWDGSIFGDVVGYRPLIAIGTPPSGGGTLYEQINVLTGAKRQSFRSDGKTNVYHLAESNIDSLDYVMINGEIKILTTDYTMDLTAGTVTTSTILLNNITAYDDVEIGWTKGSGQRDLILKNRAAIIYGGANDNRVFMWGNSYYKNRRFYSGLADGVPSAEYFPANYWSDVGSSYAITDIVKQFDRQIIFTEGNAYYSYYELIGEDVGFPVYPLNDVKGNIAFNQARTILNNPYSIYEGIYEWVATNVRDERNAKYISHRVQMDLDTVDLSQVITYDYELNGEYWLCVDNTAWIHNYRNDTWYKYELDNNIKCLIEIDGELYFGTDTGQIMKFDEKLRNDNGNRIESEWQMGFFDFGIEYITKYLNNIWISLKPDSKSSVDVKWESDKAASLSKSFDFTELYFGDIILSIPQDTVGYNLFNYETMSYSKWSYETNYSPQPFKFKLKAKKFTYFKLILANDSMIDNAIVLSINFKPRYGGESK